MMMYQMEHFVVRKTVSISTIRNNGSGMLLQNVTCILGKRILEPSVSSFMVYKRKTQSNKLSALYRNPVQLNRI